MTRWLSPSSERLRHPPEIEAADWPAVPRHRGRRSSDPNSAAVRRALASALCGQFQPALQCEQQCPQRRVLRTSASAPSFGRVPRVAPPHQRRLGGVPLAVLDQPRRAVRLVVQRLPPLHGDAASSPQLRASDCARREPSTANGARLRLACPEPLASSRAEGRRRRPRTGWPTHLSGVATTQGRRARPAVRWGRASCPNHSESTDCGSGIPLHSDRPQ